MARMISDNSYLWAWKLERNKKTERFFVDFSFIQS